MKRVENLKKKYFLVFFKWIGISLAMCLLSLQRSFFFLYFIFIKTNNQWFLYIILGVMLCALCKLSYKILTKIPWSNCLCLKKLTYYFTDIECFIDFSLSGNNDLCLGSMFGIFYLTVRKKDNFIWLFDGSIFAALSWSMFSFFFPLILLVSGKKCMPQIPLAIIDFWPRSKLFCRLDSTDVS